MSRVWWNGIYYQDQLEAQTTIEDPYFVHYTTRSPHKWAIERQTSIFPGYRVFHKAKPDANWVCIAWGRYNPCGTGIGSGQQPVASKTIPPAYGDRAGTPAQSVSVTFDAPERSKLDRQDEQLTLSTSNDTYTNIVLTQADSSQPNSDDRPSFYRRATSTDHATNDAKDTKTISITWRYNAQRERSLYKTSPRTPQIVRVTPQSRPWAEPIDFMVSDADHSIGEERFGNFGSKPISDERGDMAELAQTE